MLLFFYYLDDYFSLNDNKEKLNKLFLETIDLEIIKNKGKGIFYSLIVIRILTKIVSNNFGKNIFKKKIFEKIIIQLIYFFPMK